MGTFHTTCNVLSILVRRFQDVGDLKQETVDGLLLNPLLPELISLWQDFLNHLCHNNGELSAYWMLYIDLVENIILFFCVLLVKEIGICIC